MPLHALKGAPVNHRLSVLVQLDNENRSVRLVVTGWVTEANQHVLYPLVRRARTLLPPVTVSVDLTAAGYVEAIAVDLLRWAVDHDEPVTGAGPVQILCPDGLPVLPPRIRPDRRSPERRPSAAGMSGTCAAARARTRTVGVRPAADGGVR